VSEWQLAGTHKQRRSATDSLREARRGRIAADGACGFFSWCLVFFSPLYGETERLNDVNDSVDEMRGDCCPIICARHESFLLLKIRRRINLLVNIAE